MIILFAPAKTFKYDQSFQKADLRFPNKTHFLVEQIKKWTTDDIQKNFNVSQALSFDVKSYFDTFHDGNAYQAFNLYNGVSYQSLDFNSLSDIEKKRLNEQTFVIDALYGLIRPFDQIKPYRLDFNTKSLSLRSYWKKSINTFLESIHKPILSLTSTEFLSLVSISNPIFEVSFIDCLKNKCKAISVFNKQNRGALLRHIITNNIQKIEDLPMVFNGYHKEVNGFKITYKKVSHE